MNIKIDKSKTLTANEVLASINRLKSETDEKTVEKLKNDIVMTNIGLVRMVMKPYCKFKTIDQDDMFSEGIVGIYSAIDKFDTSSKTKFSTYAYWWIKQKIQRYVESNCLNRIDKNSVEIDKPIGDGEDGKTIGDGLQARSNPIPDISEISIKKAIVLAMKTLTARELKVLNYRYALGNM